MRIVIQRVNHASVKVDGETIGSIGKGYLLLLGVAQGDTKEMVDRYVKKLSTLRIFADKEGKTNLSITDVGGDFRHICQDGEWRHASGHGEYGLYITSSSFSESAPGESVYLRYRTR